MRHWIMAAASAAAMTAGSYSLGASAHTSGASGGWSPGFSHGFGHFQTHPPPGALFGFSFRRGPAGPFAFRRAGYGGEVAAGDDDVDDYDYSYDDEGGGMHFRVQDSFGPWDVGRRPPPEERYDSGPWEPGRVDPWHGYGPDAE